MKNPIGYDDHLPKCPHCNRCIVHMIHQSKAYIHSTYTIEVEQDTDGLLPYEVDMEHEINDKHCRWDSEYICPHCNKVITKDRKKAHQILMGLGD